jgi:hypothetical protein
LHAFNFDINNRAFSVTYLYLLIEFYNVFTVKIKYYVQKYAISRKNGCCNLALSVVSVAAKEEKKIKNGIKGNLKKLVQKFTSLSLKIYWLPLLLPTFVP